MRLILKAISADEIRLQSYGRITRALDASPEGWEDKRGSLYDPAIFGPEADWICSCGKYQGERFEDFVCDICGTRIGSSRRLRRTRFGHIDLPSLIRHPLVEGSPIEAIPVLPIAYRGVTNASDIDYLYNRLLRARCIDADAKESCPAPQNRKGLEEAVLQLFANDLMDAPLTTEGRVVRSLWHFGFSPLTFSALRVGYFLFALCMKVEADR